MVIKLDPELREVATPEMEGLDLFSVPLRAALKRPASGFVYIATTRSVLISYIYNFAGEYARKTWNYGHTIGYECLIDPFTGSPLPVDLDDIIEKVVKKEIGRDLFEMNSKIDYSVPREFVSAEWWVKRDFPEKAKKFKPRSAKEVDFTPYRSEFPADYPRYMDNRFFERPPHMCEIMRDMIEESRTSFFYNPLFRSYGIRDFDNPAEPIFCRAVRTIPIVYCPACGTKLPEPLHTEWREAVATAGFDPNDPDLPKEFFSDTWWREAGI